ncbi:VCBS repeat-containing protein [Streptomyces sp. TLI_105]|uniref:FG-GAP repeat domain-containing protein n=1 Tax=Streptomyces sp. TLI_105 TaxID=1881019 RepID=UPI00089A545C|nr:VCBS repeat-containing protein [Streptomyces sp. TLI_105]SED06171.1 Repeat domain-containing protein [Streptomyces sp. TLI_105]
MQLRSTGARLATAVTVVLAVTALGAGTLATAPAAFAATSASSEQAAATLPVFPEGSELAGVGATGFLSSSFDESYTRNLLWTPYDGGASTEIQQPEGGGVFVAGSDVVVIGDASWNLEMRSITLRNMADPAAPAVSIDLGALNGTYVTVLSPTSVLAQIMTEQGWELHVVTKDGATTTSRKVEGLPEDASEFVGSTTHDGSVLVGYATGPEGARTGGRALIDVAAGTVTETYASAESGYDFTSLMFSGSHVAWLDYDSTSGLYVTSVDRKTGDRKKTVLGVRDGKWYYELVGDRLVYGNPSKAALAVSLTGGETLELGVTASSSAAAADGSAVLRGSRAADGDGLFRVAAGADGTPTVTKVAETGTPVAEQPLAIDEVHVPDTADLDKTGGKVTLGWTLSRADAYLDVTLTHVATGKEFKKRLTAPASGTLFSFDWDGVIDGVDAPNGTYGVEAEATLLDGTGEPAYQGWLMNVVRAADPHDYTNNGSTDVLARDAAGVLWRDDLRDRPVNGQVAPAKRTKLGAGFQAYNAIEAAGNLAGGPAGDFVARDTTGVLWSFLGKGDGTFVNRTRIGAGWGAYNKIAAGSDLTGDGRPDLVAVDGAGALWLHKATGKWDAPYAARVRLASAGFNTYNQLTAVGDVAGTVAGDVVARDTAGVLWLFPGKGDGTFAPRVRIGGGWGVFSQLVGAGDLDNDGRPDLIAYGSGGTYVYHSTGSVTTPFSRRTTSLYAGEGTKFNSIA